MNCEGCGQVQNGAVMVLIEVLLWYLSGQTEKNHENLNHYI